MTDAELRAIADELAIRRLLDEYCLRLEVNVFEEWLDLFTDDTEYHVFRRVLRGRAKLSAMLSLAPHGVHLPGATRITLNGDEAEALQSYLFIAASDSKWNAGWYQRTVVRTPQGWKIAKTRIKIGRIGELGEDAKPGQLEFPVSFA